MTRKTTSLFSQIMTRIIDPADFRAIVREHQGDKHSKGLRFRDQLISMLYSLEHHGAVTVRVEDICGRVLLESIVVHFGPGVYRRTFDVAQLPPGVYLYSVEAFGRRETGKFVR